MKAQEIRKQFSEMWSMAVAANPRMKSDKPAKSESFGFFIDALCRDGKITQKQYDTVTMKEGSK